MTENNVVQLLEHMGRSYRRSYVPMDQSRVESIRALLVQEISSASQELGSAEAPARVSSPIFSFPSFASLFTFNALRPVLAVLVIGIFATGSLLQVASASLPGDALYTVKLVKEAAQVRLAVDQKARTKLAVQFAVTRADEMRQVVEGDEPREQKSVRLSIASKKLEAHVADVSETLAATADKKELAGVMEDGATQIVSLLTQAKADAVKGNGIVEAQVAKVLSEMTETKALIELASNPPTALAQSVPTGEARFAVSADNNTLILSPTNRKISNQSATLVNPAQSVFSLPFAASITSSGNLPFAVSIGSAQ